MNQDIFFNFMVISILATVYLGVIYLFCWMIKDIVITFRRQDMIAKLIGRGRKVISGLEREQISVFYKNGFIRPTLFLLHIDDHDYVVLDTSDEKLRLRNCSVEPQFNQVSRDWSYSYAFFLDAIHDSIKKININ